MRRGGDKAESLKHKAKNDRVTIAIATGLKQRKKAIPVDANPWFILNSIFILYQGSHR